MTTKKPTFEEAVEAAAEAYAINHGPVSPSWRHKSDIVDAFHAGMERVRSTEVAEWKAKHEKLKLTSGIAYAAMEKAFEISEAQVAELKRKLMVESDDHEMTLRRNDRYRDRLRNLRAALEKLYNKIEHYCDIGAVEACAMGDDNLEDAMEFAQEALGHVMADCRSLDGEHTGDE